MTTQPTRDFYEIDWAIAALHEAEAKGFTGTHACLSAEGWRTAGHLTIEQAEHLLRDGAEAAEWTKAEAER